MTLGRFSVGEDNRTPMERLRGRKELTPIACFGDKVHFSRVKKNKNVARGINAEYDWGVGVWMGLSLRANEHIIGIPDGTIRANTINIMHEGERWCKEMIKSVRGTPAQPNPDMPGFRIPVRVRMPESQTPQEATRTRARD